MDEVTTLGNKRTVHIIIDMDSSLVLSAIEFTDALFVYACPKTVGKQKATFPGPLTFPGPPFPSPSPSRLFTFQDLPLSFRAPYIPGSSLPSPLPSRIFPFPSLRTSSRQRKANSRASRRQGGPDSRTYETPNLRLSALSTHGGTNFDTSPPSEAISRTMDDDRYICCGVDMMNSVSSSSSSW